MNSASEQRRRERGAGRARARILSGTGVLLFGAALCASSSQLAETTSEFQHSRGYAAFRDQTLERALLQRLRASILIEKLEVARYYQEHADDLRVPFAMKLWRILVATRPEAQALVDSLLPGMTVQHWGELAKEHSIDRRTKYENGDLGLVDETGRTRNPDLHVDVNLFRGAMEVPDSALVPRPVEEGGRFAVLWRRGTRLARALTLAQTGAWIQRLLTEEKLAARRHALLLKLRTERVRQIEPHWLELVSPSFDLGIRDVPESR